MRNSISAEFFRNFAKKATAIGGCFFEKIFSNPNFDFALAIPQ